MILVVIVVDSEIISYILFIPTILLTLILVFVPLVAEKLSMVVSGIDM